MASLNGGLGADNVYVIINPPQPVLPAGVIISSGLASGLCTWGPKGVPIGNNTPQSLFKVFGPPANSGRDLVQEGTLFLNQFPLGSFIGIRGSDGTDLPAQGNLVDTTTGNVTPGAAIVAKYTGTFGNSIIVAVAPGSNSVTGALTWKVTVSAANAPPEQWDRLVGNSATVAWANIIAAINNGTSALNPPSQYIVASQPNTPSSQLPAGSTVAPQMVTLTGATNGGPPSDSALLGQDGTTGVRTGIYSGRGTGFDVAWICGSVTSSTWPTLLAFAKSENAYAIGNCPPNTSPTAAAALKVASGVDDPNFVAAVGTITYLDTFFNQNVTIPQAAVIAGTACGLPTYEPVGNRQVYGCLGTEQTLGPNPQPYSASDLALLEANGLICITSPIPGANALGTRWGKNSSSNFATSEISYTRQVNSYVRAFQGPVLGQFVNRRQTTKSSDPLRNAVSAALNGYLAPQKLSGQINDYVVVCDLTNNSPASIAAGVLNATVIIKLDGVVNQFVINLTAGQTVSIVTTQTGS